MVDLILVGMERSLGSMSLVGCFKQLSGTGRVNPLFIFEGYTVDLISAMTAGNRLQCIVSCGVFLVMNF